MADAVIDKLIFALGGDTAPIKGAFAEVEAGAAKTGDTVKQNLGQGFKDAAAQASQGSATLGKSLSDAAGHAERLGNHIGASRREMVYFVREMATGDIQRIPATLALMASHFLNLSGAAIATGGAIAAPILGLVVATEKANIAIAKLRTSLSLTGNYSGLTLSGAAGIASQTGTSNAIVGSLISNFVPANSMAEAARATSSYDVATGGNEEETAKIIGKMFSDPEKSAAELNQTMRLLTTAQTEEVSDLQRRGETEKAGQIILDAFNEKAHEAAEGASRFAIASKNAAIILEGIKNWAAGPQTTAQQIAALQSKRQMILNGTFSGEQTPDKDLADTDAAIKRLEAQQVQDFQKNYATGEKARRDNMVGQGLAAYKKGAGTQDEKQTALDQDLDAANTRLNAAKLIHSDFTTQLEAEAKAAERVDNAYKQYGGPVKEAQRQAANAEVLKNTPLEKQAGVAAAQQARDEHIRDLMNPALSNEQVGQMGAAEQARAAANKGEANIAKEQDKRVATIEAEAAAALKVAAAYGISTAAGDKARIEGEAEVQVKENQIRASQAHSVALSKEAIAYAAASEAASKEIQTLRQSNAGLGLEVAAGGNPQAVAQAKRQAAADAFAQKQLDTADLSDPMALADIGAKKRDYLAELGQKDQSNAYINLDAAHETAKQNLGNLQGQVGAFSSGQSDDYSRHLKIQQDAVDQVSKELQKSDPLYQQHIDDLTKTNTAISDLTDSFSKAQKEASGLATDITGGLASWLKNPGQNPMDALAGIGQNMLSTIVQSQILDPMNKWLTSQFGSMLGVGALGASAANPMYVVDANNPLEPIGTPLGAPGGGGGLFSGLFGGSDGSAGLFSSSSAIAGDAGMADIADMGADIGGSVAGAGSGIGTFLTSIGLAAGGPMEAGKTYLVGENGPEFMTANMGGTVTPLSAPVVRAALGSQVNGDGTSYGGAGRSSVDRGGDNYHFHLPGVTDPVSFIRAKSQIANTVTLATSMGRRNS